MWATKLHTTPGLPKTCWDTWDSQAGQVGPRWDAIYSVIVPNMQSLVIPLLFLLCIVLNSRAPQRMELEL